MDACFQPSDSTRRITSRTFACFHFSLTVELVLATAHECTSFENPIEQGSGIRFQIVVTVVGRGTLAPPKSLGDRSVRMSMRDPIDNETATVVPTDPFGPPS